MSPTASLATGRSESGLGELLSPTDVSAYLGIPPTTLANWRYLRRGPAYLRVGRHVRYRSADVAAWVEQQITPTEADHSCEGTDGIRRPLNHDARQQRLLAESSSARARGQQDE